jgi:CRISP-associated protein Cas1
LRLRFRAAATTAPHRPHQSTVKPGIHAVASQTAAVVQSLGLDAELGHLHLPCHHEQPLVCDLIAEFRPLLVDELVVKLATNSIITPEHFVAQNGSGIVLSPQVLKTFIRSWENKLQTPVVHLYAGTVSYRHCLKLQVQEYIACLVGDVDYYRPMLLKANKIKAEVLIEARHTRASVNSLPGLNSFPGSAWERVIG